VYFTNMVSARPLFGSAGASSLPGIVATQTAGRERFGRMVAFFEKPKPVAPVIVAKAKSAPPPPASAPKTTPQATPQAVVGAA
jgi:hypothetical protein